MYIRTKDGVYDTSKGLYTPSIKMWAIGTVTIYDEQIIRKSETIEELCDEFCYIKDGVVSQYLTISFKYKRDDEFCALRNKLTANAIVEISKGISKYELENGELKFAIWTSKGLIYVAKMNENGELELI